MTDTPTDPYAEALLEERAQVAFWDADDKDRIKAIDAELKAAGVAIPKAPKGNQSRAAQRRAAEAAATEAGREPGAKDHSEDASGDAPGEPNGTPGDPASA